MLVPKERWLCVAERFRHEPANRCCSCDMMVESYFPRAVLKGGSMIKSGGVIVMEPYLSGGLYRLQGRPRGSSQGLVPSEVMDGSGAGEGGEDLKTENCYY